MADRAGEAFCHSQRVTDMRTIRGSDWDQYPMHRAKKLLPHRFFPI